MKSLQLPPLKSLEYLVLEHDPTYEAQIDAIEYVKDFIIKNGLIIYGGTAIDMALRLKGDQIYPDDSLKIPDLDFYSPTSVEHAYELADILYKAGHKEVRAIVATHATAMRVDLISNHFIADIGYKPKEVFDHIPTLLYNGMKIVNPIYQRIDMHSALSFPYDDPPKEVIFARWSKDIKRFNKVAEHYPAVDIFGGKGKKPTPAKITVPISYHQYVFCGEAAYAILGREFMRITGKSDLTFTAAEVTDTNITFPCDRLEFVHFEPEKLVEKTGFVLTDEYRAYANLIPARLEGMTPGASINTSLSTPTTIYSTKNRLLSVNSIDISGHKFRIPNTQFLLKHFLGQYLTTKDVYYLDIYNNIIKMMQTVEDLAAENKDLLDTPFFPSIVVYGSKNISSAREIQINRMYNDMRQADLYVIPWNYYPDRAQNRPHPTFDYAIEFFHDDGGKVEKKEDEK